MFGLVLGWVIIVGLIGFALMAIAPDKLQIVIRTMQGGVGKSLGSGLIGQLAIVPGAVAVCVLLAATLIGILLIPLGLVAFMFLVAGIAMFGFVAVATMTGAAITGGKNRDATPHGAMLRAFFTGTAVYLGMWLITAAFSATPWRVPLSIMRLRNQGSASRTTTCATSASCGSSWRSSSSSRRRPAASASRWRSCIRVSTARRRSCSRPFSARTPRRST